VHSEEGQEAQRIPEENEVGYRKICLVLLVDACRLELVEDTFMVEGYFMDERKQSRTKYYAYTD